MKPSSFNTQNLPPKHGGNLEDAIKQYGIKREDWIDLSSGVSPWAWPFKSLPENTWTDLPPSNQALLKNAASYYQCELNHIAVSPGSQLAIRLIAQQLPSSTVAIPSLGYQEHRYSWQLAGHEIHYYRSLIELGSLISSNQVEHAVLINPNNPTGELVSANEVNNIAQKLTGLLVVDEAFMDLHQHSDDKDHQSAIKQPHENQIVLRSVGKFFGLAGLRVGFVIGTHPIVKGLSLLLEPWSLNHASQYITTKMLTDADWHRSQAIKINAESKNFENIIRGFSHIMLNGFHISNGGLFITVFANKSSLNEIHTTLAKSGIWSRLHNPNDEHSWIRFSLTKQPMKCQDIFEKIISLKQ